MVETLSQGQKDWSLEVTTLQKMIFYLIKIKPGTILHATCKSEIIEPNEAGIIKPSIFIWSRLC